MQLRFITTADALYTAELELRYRVLREPLGRSRSEVVFPFEEESLHLLALEEDAVVGCVLFQPENPTSGRLLQMAVAPARQGRGLGQSLVRALEAELRMRGVRQLHLHARETVVPFYERLGYTVVGAPFVEVTIPHRHMRRTL
jgi:ribosomal protein S18 acetylase RimI-like enzyme